MKTESLNRPVGTKIRDAARPAASPYYAPHAYTYGASNPRLRPATPANEESS